MGKVLQIAGSVGHWKRACDRAARLDAGDHEAARAFFESEFRAYRVFGGDDERGRVTGYYVESLRGSRRRHGRYRTPIYRRPPDLVTVDLTEHAERPEPRRIAGRVVRGRLVPFESRAQIAAGALAGRGLELLWVDDPIAAFFAQVQGSAVVALDDGTTVAIGVDGHNGHPYTAIGRVLIARGALDSESVSMQSIRAWMEAHPEDAPSLMNENAGFVFFAETRRAGAVGAQGVELTAERSVAVDPLHVALGTPLWLDTRAPVAGSDTDRAFRQLVIAQDTGGAILGPVRADVFWGAGAEAADIAGRTKSTGRYALFLPRDVPPPLP